MKRIILFLVGLYISCLSLYSQILTDSNLPIIVINTDGGFTIPDDPRILATMKIIYRGEGQRNYLTDQNNPVYLNYDGRINIEIRGSASQVLPKKAYGFSTLKSDNFTNNNVSLLGMPDDNDWILNGLGFEPSLIRDYLCYNLSRRIGEYASRTAFCEVVINGSYNGLYVLEEKIKQGKHRVNVTDITTTDNVFPKVTGGYITKADKTTGGDPVAWTMSSLYGNNDIAFIHELPKPENVTSSQNNYIHSEFQKLQTATSVQNSDFISGYPSVIDIPSFVDYMIINELGSNADAYQFSTFYHKDRNGKLRAGPIWDLNLTFGYDLSIWGFDRSKTNNWQFANGDNEGPKFWRDLFYDPDFRCILNKRWNQLIQPGQPLNYGSLEPLIDSTVTLISEAAVRENQAWGTVPSLTAETNKIKDFLQLRIPWITQNIAPNTVCPVVKIPPLVITKIMYHPDSTLNFPDSGQQEFIEITNTGTETIDLTGVYFSGTGFVYQFPAYLIILPGSSKIIAGNSEVFIQKYRVSPAGQFTRNLSNGGEKLVLADGFGNVIDSLTYSDHFPWPDADGNGFYLDLPDPLSDNSLGSNWTASANTILSVDELIKDEVPRLYPLPVQDALTIDFPRQINSVELYDFQGKVITRKDVHSVTCRLDMSNLPRGIYLVRINTSAKTYVHKIIKN